MKLFSGFPNGKLQVTPLPNLFFTELLAGIDDLAELKTTLHLFWLLANRKNRVLYIRAGELAADPVLSQSLAAIDPRPEQALERALALATERGTLLHLAVPSAGGQSNQDLYFLNTESGRRAFEQAEHSGIPLTPTTESGPVPPVARPNIFALYEQNIGLLTPMLSEELKEAEQTYPAEWIQDAFKIAAENNKRSWSYIRAILQRWKTEGRTEVEGSKKRKHWWDDEYDKFIKR